MQIKVNRPVLVQYFDKATGERKSVVLTPGKDAYPMLTTKDPIVQEQIRVHRKHGAIAITDRIPGDENKGGKNYLQPNPVGRQVVKEKKQEPKKPKKGSSNGYVRSVRDTTTEVGAEKD